MARGMKKMKLELCNQNYIFSELRSKKKTLLTEESKSQFMFILNKSQFI